MYHPSNINNFLGAIGVSGILSIVLIFVLIVISAFFSTCETAFTSVNSLRLKSLAEEKKKGARRALFIAEDYEKTLSTILVGNNLVNIASTTVCAFLFAKIFVDPTLANILNTIVMTIIILTFGEVFPKSLGKSQPENVAMRFAGLLHFSIIVLTPIVWPFKQLQRVASKRARISNSPTVTENELESIIDTMEEEGVIESQNADMIQNVIRIGDVTAYDIMTPRVDMICADIDSSIDLIQKLFVEHQFTRIPIYKNNRDNIVGVINQKDLFAAIVNNKRVDIKSIMTEPMFVSETIKVDDLIREIQSTKIHLCVVLDEYGGTSGIVTMEDCLEEMVGEIYDEHDDDEVLETIVKIEDNKYLINAEMSITQLFDELEIEHLPDTNYSTVAGLLYEFSEELPRQGMVIKFTTIDEQIDEHSNFVKNTIEMVFTVTKMIDRRIREVELEISLVSKIEN